MGEEVPIELEKAYSTDDGRGTAGGCGVGMSVEVVHVLVLTFPIASHVNPLLQLATKLSAFAETYAKPSRRREFVFTCVMSEHAAAQRLMMGPAQDQQGQQSIRIVGLPDPHPPPPAPEFRSQLAACDRLRPAVERLLPSLLLPPSTSSAAGLPPVSCVLADVFVTWAHDVASSSRLPLFLIFTSNATACCVMSHAHALLAAGIIPFSDDERKRITCPGAPPLLPREFPPSMQTKDTSFYRFQFTLSIFRHLDRAAGLILNSCLELEPAAVHALSRKCPVYTVGPLLLPPNGGPPRQQETWPADHPCKAWLDRQPPLSVLYVSFGSLSTFSDRAQMRELALGLEVAQQPFLWVVRADAIEGAPLEDVLPPGFLDRNRDRCLIVPWVPQLLVLAHPAVGAFLTHCGWNSALENITLRGLPMLCWPDIAEQMVNARLLVDEWRLGMEFQRTHHHGDDHEDHDNNAHGHHDARDDGDGDGDGGQLMVPRREVERVIRAVMQGQAGKEMRQRGAQLKSLVEEVVRRGGSSFNNLASLITTMLNTAPAVAPNVGVPERLEQLSVA